MNDKEFETYLSGKSALSSQYQAEPAPEIPERVDNTILGIARMSTDAQQSAKVSFLKHWQKPITLAAVLVLSVSLVLTLYDDYGEDYLQSPAPAKPAAIQSSAPVAADEMAPPAPADEGLMPLEEQAVESDSDGMAFDDMSGTAMDSVQSVDREQRSTSIPAKASKLVTPAVPMDKSADVPSLRKREATPERQTPVTSNQHEALEEPALEAVDDETTTAPLLEAESELEPSANPTEDNQNILGINEKVDVLESEVELLRQKQTELIKERQAIQADIDKVEGERRAIESKLFSNEVSEQNDTRSTVKNSVAPQTKTPGFQAEIDTIYALWRDLEQQQAIERLRDFRTQYQFISDEDLLETLPKSLIDAAR